MKFPSGPIPARNFFLRPTPQVAIELLGSLLVSTIEGRRASGIIVETEAYQAAGDSACHGARGRTAGNATMFGPAGRAYVYPIHGRYCFNVVTEAVDAPSAVLIRALQPIDGIELMKTRRGTDRLMQLCSGPAKLCQALCIDRTNDGLDLSRRRQLWIEHAGAVPRFRVTKRIGVTSAKHRRLRFVVRDCPFASGPRSMR